MFDAAPSTRDAALARAAARRRVEFAIDDTGRNVLARLGQRSPARVVLPRPDRRRGGRGAAQHRGRRVRRRPARGEARRSGRAPGDRRRPGGRARLPGARPARRRSSRGSRSRPAAALHWAPQETILFDGAVLERRTELRTAGDARLLAAETLVFGRRAMGELVRALHLRDEWRLWRSGRLVWADSLRLVADDADRRSPPRAGFADTTRSAPSSSSATTSTRRATRPAACSGRAGLGRRERRERRARGARARRRRSDPPRADAAPLHPARDGLGFEPALPRVWSC